MIVKAEEVIRAMGMIYDTFDENNIHTNVGMSACINVVIGILSKEGVEESYIEGIVQAMEICIKTLNNDSCVEKFIL